MLDARNIYRKVTRKIYDFSPEQLQNLAAIVWLYRGQQERFLKLVEIAISRRRSRTAKRQARRSTAFEEALGKLDRPDRALRQD